MSILIEIKLFYDGWISLLLLWWKKVIFIPISYKIVNLMCTSVTNNARKKQ